MNKIIQKLKKEYHGKKVLIVGLGLQGGGVGLAKFLCNLGAKVTVTDKKSKDILQPSLIQLKNFAINFTLGTHKIDDFLNADVIFKGPSVRWDSPEIIKAQAKGIPVEMEMAFFAAYCPAKIIGVTGTRGKSTTTMMIYEILKKSGVNVQLAGNIPNISTINLLSSITANDWVVMELASWPLSGFHMKKISPHIAVFTNFYPDHLNYYQSMDDYLYDKKAIYVYQKPEDHLVINENLKSSLFAKASRDKQISKDKIKSHIHFFSSGSFQSQLLYLKGEHNLENAACATEITKILGLNLDKARNVLINFKGLPYRQEIIGKKRGIIFINDTTSTTPVATVKAIDTFADNPILLILGGTSKNLPYCALINRLIDIKKIILLKGSFTDEILPILQKKYPEKITEIFGALSTAVKKAYEFAQIIKNDNIQQKIIILFSPAAPSFAMFNNEFHRGDEFNKVVKKLITEK